MITTINEFKQSLNEKKISLQQDSGDKLKISLDEEIILKHAKKMFKKIKTIKDVTSLGSSDYNKLIKHLYNIKQPLNEGRGNTIIRYENHNWPTYYIEYYSSTDEDEDGNEYENENANDNFIDDVVGNISHFKTVNLTKLDKPEWLNNDQSIYFEGENIKIVFADNEWSLAVGVIPIYEFNENDEEVIPAGFNDEATKFFNELKSLYNLSVANGAWMSSKVDSDIIINQN